jgi:hypothetical protein
LQHNVSILWSEICTSQVIIYSLTKVCYRDTKEKPPLRNVMLPLKIQGGF